ncbi:MAG: hypothetical protein KGJ78_02420 [Alphaproteobacteria bacterium]|nr:hypothetical protein [Alphaproteobacteria bacterium]
MNTFKRIILGFSTTLLMAAPQAGAQLAGSTDPALYAGLTWRLVGPFRAGWATTVAGIPGKPDTYYFGAAGGGVWRTDDAGRTWRSVFDHGPAPIGAIAVAPSDPHVLYVGTGQVAPRYDVAAGLGVYKSTDDGAHWQSVGLQNTRYIGAILIDPKNPKSVLVGAQGHFFGPSADRGIYRTIDGGKSWAHVLKLGAWTGVADLARDPKRPNIVFAAAWEARQYPWLSYFTPVTGPGSALYKSSDGGATWHKLGGVDWPKGDLGRIGLAVTHIKKGTRLYADVVATQGGGLYRSDDGGAHWIFVNKAKAVTNWYFSRIAVAPNDPDVVYTVGQSIHRCAAGGRTCTILKGSPGGDDYHALWINPLHPDHLITGSDQGAVVSVNGGGTWSSWYNQPTGQFYHLAADNRFPYWIYSGQQDSGTVGIASRSDYGSISFRDWHSVGGDERDYDIPDPADPTIVYGSGLGGHVSKWNGGTGQVETVTPYPDNDYGKRPTLVKYRYMWMTPLEASRTGPAALYLGAQVLFRSTDRGATWQVISPDLTGKVDGASNCAGDVTPEEAKSCGFGVISAIEPSPRHADEIWVGTDDGLIQLTRDGGAHWLDVTPPVVPLWAKVRAVSVSAVEDGAAYAAIDTHRIDRFQPLVLRTRDYGKTWQEIDTGLPADHFASVVRADPVRAGLLYAGTDEGVYVSFDDGDHWQTLQQNLPNAWITDLLVHGNDLIAATEGRAIWVMDDITPLRQVTAGLAAEPAHLFTPAPAVRVHADNNKDTPLPPETPVGQNPPVGAALDYWIGAQAKGPVTLDVRDASGALIRHFSSAEPAENPDAERYFEKGWVRPLQVLSAAPGMHRFVWDLRYARPRAVSYSYSIAAVWGRATPITPQGPFILPGDYTATLTTDGRTYTAPLRVTEDPRVQATPADLRASLALSQRIAAALAEARLGYGEQQAMRKQLDARFPAGRSHSTLQDLADKLREKPASTTPTFASASDQLAGIENALEAADAAPSEAQRQTTERAFAALADAQRAWSAQKAGLLAQLNAALTGSGQKPITIPASNDLEIDAPDPGQDLP